MACALEEILPASVSVATTREEIPVTLFPEEAAAVEHAVQKRLREFTTGRACARVALERWGLSEQPIPVGTRGEPRWPVGFVGSITHCEGYRACAVAREADVTTIGIDAEPNKPLPERVGDEVASTAEAALIRRLARTQPGISWDRLLFSAKEAVYKAWFPLTRRWLGFDDTELAIDSEAGTFSARLLAQEARMRGEEARCFDGSWALDGGTLLTAVAVLNRQA